MTSKERCDFTVFEIARAMTKTRGSSSKRGAARLDGGHPSSPLPDKKVDRGWKDGGAKEEARVVAARDISEFLVRGPGGKQA